MPTATAIITPNKTMAGSNEVEANDARVVDIAKYIKVLSALTWGTEPVERFLAQWRAGDPRLPETPAVPPVEGSVLDALREVEKRVDRSDPRGAFVAETAMSYRQIGEMLGAAGSPTFHRLSREIYGGPNEPFAGAEETHVEAADRLIASTADLTEASDVSTAVSTGAEPDEPTPPS